MRGKLEWAEGRVMTSNESPMQHQSKLSSLVSLAKLAPFVMTEIIKEVIALPVFLVCHPVVFCLRLRSADAITAASFESLREYAGALPLSIGTWLGIMIYIPHLLKG
jgi:hypothetical protein